MQQVPVKAGRAEEMRKKTSPKNTVHGTMRHISEIGKAAGLDGTMFQNLAHGRKKRKDQYRGDDPCDCRGITGKRERDRHDNRMRRQSPQKRHDGFSCALGT